MTNLLLTLSVVCLTTMIATSSMAYGTEPDAGMIHQIAVSGQTDVQLAQSTKVCKIKVTPDLAQLIGLDPDWRAQVAVATALACAAH